MPAPSTRTARTETPDGTASEAAPKGGWWESLTNLSKGRGPSDKEKAADIIHPHEKVWLTEDESHGFLTRHKRPVIRPWRDRSEPAPQITARDLFGPQGRPTAAQFGAREDPPGASHVIENPSDPENHPEASDPVTDLSIDPDAARDK